MLPGQPGAHLAEAHAMIATLLQIAGLWSALLLAFGAGGPFAGHPARGGRRSPLGDGTRIPRHVCALPEPSRPVR